MQIGSSAIEKGQEGVAGPLRMTVQEVESGDAALQSVLGASGFNEQLADGLQYLTVKLTIANTSNQPIVLDQDDFFALDATGEVHRFAGVIPPSPAINGTLDAGAQTEGWVVGIADVSESAPALVFDSLSITGNWADQTFALFDQVPTPQPSTEAANEVGSDATSPAASGATVITDEWKLTLNDVFYGQDVYNLFPASDYRTTALGDAAPESVPNWIGFSLLIGNNSESGIAHFPATALTIAGSDGSPVRDVQTLTPPAPDASGDYLPGAQRDGWVLFELPIGYGDNLLRFQPFETDSDIRFISWGGGGAQTTAVEPPPSPVTDLTAGAKVVTTEEGVRMRNAPSVDGDIVVELPVGSALTISGPAEQGGDYLWYPVTLDSTGQTGYVVANYVASP